MRGKRLFYINPVETPAYIMETSPTRCKILVFDSGVGGLTVAREILALSPGCELIYVADNARFPYGIIDDAPLTERILHVISCAISRSAPDIVVIACNTASTLVLTLLRSEHPSIAFVGVVPAIKPAAQITKSRTIGLLATPATVNRAYTERLIAEFAKDTQVIKYGSRELVCLAERWLNTQILDSKLLFNEIDKLLSLPGADTMDTVVLACTHFPVFKTHLEQQSCYQQLRWVDSGPAIASRVAHLITQRGCNLQGESSIGFLFSQPATSPEVLQHYARYLEVAQNQVATLGILDLDTP